MTPEPKNSPVGGARSARDEDAAPLDLDAALAAVRESLAGQELGLAWTMLDPAAVRLVLAEMDRLRALALPEQDGAGQERAISALGEQIAHLRVASDDYALVETNTNGITAYRFPAPTFDHLLDGIEEAFAALGARPEQREALDEAIRDVCWKAQPYGEDDDGMITHYLLSTGPIHRLVAAAQAAGITAPLRNAPEAVATRLNGFPDSIWPVTDEATAWIDVLFTVMPHPEGEFVETHDDQDRGIGRDHGIEWVTTQDEYARLRIPVQAFGPRRSPAAVPVPVVTEPADEAAMTCPLCGKPAHSYRCGVEG